MTESPAYQGASGHRPRSMLGHRQHNGARPRQNIAQGPPIRRARAHEDPKTAVIRQRRAVPITEALHHREAVVVQQGLQLLREEQPTGERPKLRDLPPVRLRPAPDGVLVVDLAQRLVAQRAGNLDVAPLRVRVVEPGVVRVIGHLRGAGEQRGKHKPAVRREMRAHPPEDGLVLRARQGVLQHVACVDDEVECGTECEAARVGLHPADGQLAPFGAGAGKHRGHRVEARDGDARLGEGNGQPARAAAELQHAAAQLLGERKVERAVGREVGVFHVVVVGVGVLVEVRAGRVAWRSGHGDASPDATVRWASESGNGNHQQGAASPTPQTASVCAWEGRRPEGELERGQQPVERKVRPVLMGCRQGYVHKHLLQQIRGGRARWLDSASIRAPPRSCQEAPQPREHARVGSEISEARSPHNLR